MPKTTLEFTLPDDREELVDAMQAGDYRAVLDELREYLRGLLKYDAEGMDAATIEAIQKRYFEILAEWDVSL